MKSHISYPPPRKQVQCIGQVLPEMVVCRDGDGALCLFHQALVRLVKLSKLGSPTFQPWLGQFTGSTQRQI